MRFILSIMLFASISVSTEAFQELRVDSISVVKKSSIGSEKLPLVEDRAIKNVIFIIGDGTGLAQLFTGQANLVGTDNWLNIQRMPVTGLVTTHAANRLITDSAAGATAYSCGIKTNNGMIGQLPDGKPCKTLLELAEDKGMTTGLVATSTITHATPASFASHIDSRSKQAEIAEQFLLSEVEILFGGGLEYFIPQNDSVSLREDDRNLITEFTDHGYDFVENLDQMIESESNKILGLFSDSGIPSIDRTPTLGEMTEKAIYSLNNNESGFFLMVEGSQIDWAGHANDVNYALRELADFDAAVKSILDFATEDGETLVILTADHETGGMNVLSGSTEEQLKIVWTTDYHTGIPVPIMAYGPHAIEFTGWWDNTDIAKKIAKLSGLGELPIISE